MPVLPCPNNVPDWPTPTERANLSNWDLTSWALPRLGIAAYLLLLFSLALIVVFRWTARTHSQKLTPAAECFQVQVTRRQLNAAEMALCLL